MDAQKIAVHAMRKNVVEWGMDPVANDKHRRMRDATVVIVQTYSSGGGGPGEDITPVPRMLPDDISTAVETLLRAELVGQRNSFTLVKDRFGIPFPPYLAYPDKNKPQGYSKVLQDEFKRKTKKGLTKKDLDPFVRFSPDVYTKLDYFFKTWIQDRNDDAIEGHVLEAVVVSHAIHKMACFHPDCRARNSLRWNGGPMGPWTDMVCICCDSFFEIKSKRNMEKVEMAHVRDISGGCYASYHELLNQPRKKGWKPYVITVSRQPTYAKIQDLEAGLHKCWAVTVLEIERITPRLSEKSFLDGFDLKRTIKSQIVTSKKEPFHYKIPFVNVDYKPMLVKLLVEKFPNEMYVDDKGACLKRVPNKPKKKTAEVTATVDIATSLREELDSEDILDCWDDSSEEED